MILKSKPKHAEFTYGIHHLGLKELVPESGFTLLGNDKTVETLKAMDEYAMGARRSLIGKLCLLRQAIAYVLGYKVIPGANGLEVKFYLYRRNKKNGEGRMSGMLSMGAGGHVEHPDFQEHYTSTDEVVKADTSLVSTGSMDLLETIEESMLREFAEEVLLHNKAGEVVSEAVLGANTAQGYQRLGFVWDGIPEEQPEYVGSTHFGVVYALEIPNDVEQFEMAEEMNDALGWFNLEDIARAGSVEDFAKQFNDDVHSDANFEPWTRFIIDQLPAVQQHLIDTYHTTR